MTRRERDRLDVLRRRADYLERTIAEGPCRGEQPGPAVDRLGHARAELVALRWAIKWIEEDEAADAALAHYVRTGEEVVPYGRADRERLRKAIEMVVADFEERIQSYGDEGIQPAQHTILRGLKTILGEEVEP